VTARPAATRIFAGAYLNSVETILTSADLVSFKEASAGFSCARPRAADNVAIAGRANAITKSNDERRPDSFLSTISRSNNCCYDNLACWWIIATTESQNCTRDLIAETAVSSASCHLMALSPHMAATISSAIGPCLSVSTSMCRSR
jgi:hypothetical protein